MRERLFVQSDPYEVWVCDHCGLMSNIENRKDMRNKDAKDQPVCILCEKQDISTIKIPYACKLLFQELMAMSVVPRIITSQYKGDMSDFE